MAEGVLANLEKEYRALLAPKLLAEAKAVQVVWARVKGYPAWPAQVLTEAAALRRKDLGQERHSKGNSVPVMFFGTVEVAWVKDADVVDFKEGLHQGFFDRKTKPFKLALEQVCEYLALDRKRKAPPKWWCKPPSNGLDEQPDGQASRPASVSGSGAAKGAVQRQDASKSSRQRTTTDGSSSSSSSEEDECPAEQTGTKKGAGRPLIGKDGAGKLQQPAAVAPACKPRDSSSARPPRDNGSTTASTNTSAQAKKRPPAPQPASSRPQAAGTDAAKASRALAGSMEPAKGCRDGRSAAAATNSASNMPPPALGPQQHLKGAHPIAGVPDGNAKDNNVGLPPRKRLKVESAQEAGATAGTASSLPRPPAPKELIGHTEGCGLALGDVAVNDVLKLPAEIRRLAGIRLPAVPKKTGPKVEQSPREQASVKEEVVLTTTTPAAKTGALQMKQEDGVEMRVLRSGRGRTDDARPGQPVQGVSSQGKRSRRSSSSSDEDSPSITSSDAEDVEEEGQSSGEEADTEADENSSDDSAGSSDLDTSVVTTRKGSQRTSTAKARNRIAPIKDQAQRPRDRKGEKQRRLARFAAPEPANRRTSLRLLPKLTDKATPMPEKGSCGQSSSEGSGTEGDEHAESSREDSGSGTSSGGEGEGARDAKASDDGGSLKLCSRSRSRNGTQSEGQRQGEEATTGKAPCSREPSLSVGAGVKTRSVRGEAVSEADLLDGGKSQPRDHSTRYSTGITPAPPPAKAVPLELRRLQDSSSGAPPVVDTAEPRMLRDRSSPARRAAGSLGTTPTQTLVTTVVPGKVVPRGPSEEGSGVSMSTAAKRDGAFERSRSPDQRAGSNVATEAKETIKVDSEPALDSRHSKGSFTPGSLIASAPVASGVPVRKKPPSLGIPNTARPALLPARPMPRSASAKRDTAMPSTVPVGASMEAVTAGEVVPAAVCMHRKSSIGPPTRRVLGTVADTPVSSLDISDMAIVDCEVDAKHASSPDVPPVTTATGDGQLPRSPGAASDGAGRDISTGPVVALQSHMTSQLQVGVARVPLRADQQEQERGIDSLEHMEQVAHQALGTTHAQCRGQPKAEAQAVVAETGCQEVRSAGFALAMDVNMPLLEGSTAGSGSPADHGVRSEVHVLAATETRQQLKTMESGPGSRCVESAGSAQLQQSMRSGDAGKLFSSRPLSSCRDGLTLVEEQLPDNVDERPSPTVAQTTISVAGVCGNISAGACSALTPAPDVGGPGTTLPGAKMACAGVETVLASCADGAGSTRTDIVATVTNVSLSGVVALDSDDVDRARAEELQELGEVAAALAGLHQAELSRPSAPRPVPLSAVAVVEERSRSRSVRRPALSEGGTDQENTAASVPSSSAFQWPQPEPLLPAQEQPFALPSDWLVTRPPRYEPVKRNVWLSRNKPKRLPKDEITICACRAPPLAPPGELQRMGCGPNCLNRLSSILCDPKLCPCGELCSNRSLHLLRQPKTEVFLTENRGWGVRAMEPINKGGFIIEYAGEVIDERELGRRMDHARMNGEPHFYIMELSAGLYIDARRRGNIARLINSSCDPNCETQKWHDAATGEVRVGIFATRDIMPGEELVYDYFFSTYGAWKQSAASFICMCGAKNCRGTMDLHPEKRRDLGRRVEVFWDADGQFYRAVIVAYHPTSRKHTVMYEDGGTEKLCLDEVPHRWLDDEQCPNQRSGTRLEAGPSSVQADAVSSVPAESLRQQVADQGQDRSALDRSQQPNPAEDAAGVPVGRPQPVVSVIPVPAAVVQPPPRPVVSADQRCMLPPLGGYSSCPTAPAQGTMGKHGLHDGELHLPLKKRPRMMQQLNQQGQQLSEALPAALTDPGRGSGMTHPQGSTGSGGAVSAGVGDRSGGGADSGAGDASGLFARTSTRQECSGTGSGRVDDDANDDLDSLLEAAEAVAALRTAPIGNVPMSHTLNDGTLPLQPRHIRSVSAGALGSGLVSMVQTAKVASPRHLAAVQRSGPPNGLPPHGGAMSGRLVGGPQPHGSSSSSGLASYQSYHHARHHPLGLPGFGHHEPHDDGHPVLPDRHQLPVARSRRASGEQGDHLNNTNGYRGDLEPSSADNREDLLWRLVGIEKPKDLLPLFASRAKLRNGGPRTGNGSWIAPSHPYGKLLRALEASDLLPQADELRILAQHQSQQQAQTAPQNHYHASHSHPHSRLQAQAQVPQAQQPVQSPTQPQTVAQPAAAEVLAISAWQHATQHQAAQQLTQHGHTSAAQNGSYQTNGTDCSAANVASLLHVQQQHAAMAAAAAAAAALAASKGQLLGTTQHAAESHSMQAVPTASVQGQHIGQQQLAAAAAAAAQWQHAAHMQQQHGQIIQDLVQMYVAQHAAPQPMLAMAGTTVVGGSRCA